MVAADAGRGRETRRSELPFEYFLKLYFFFADFFFADFFFEGIQYHLLSSFMRAIFPSFDKDSQRTLFSNFRRWRDSRRKFAASKT